MEIGPLGGDRAPRTPAPRDREVRWVWRAPHHQWMLAPRRLAEQAERGAQHVRQRGGYRMKDERALAQWLGGATSPHPGLLGIQARNATKDKYRLRGEYVCTGAGGRAGDVDSEEKR